jgi:hypothetical protein
VAKATANGIREIASAINERGGTDAVNLRIAESYLLEFGKLAQKNNAMIIPSNLSDVAGIVSSVAKIFSTMNKEIPAPPKA